MLYYISCFLFLSFFFLDDDYLKKNIPPEAEELSFEVSYSEMVTEAPNRNKWKKSDIKKEDCALTVSQPFCDQSHNFLRWRPVST